MKLISAISIGLIAVSSLFASKGYTGIASSTGGSEDKIEELSDFEKAVRIIKKYETLHQPKHYPLVGYGHLVLPGEKFSRKEVMDEKEAEALLRKDLLKNCAYFRSYGKDSLLLGVLAYNIGSGATARSSVAKKLKAGNRDIYDNYVAHCRYKGKVHAGIKKRRIEEFETLFTKEEKIVEKTARLNIGKPIQISPPGGLSKNNQHYIHSTQILTSNSYLACIAKPLQYRWL